jgi:hypothetical protein
MVATAFRIGDVVRLIGTDTLFHLTGHDRISDRYKAQGTDDAGFFWVLEIYLERVSRPADSQ